MEAIHARVLGNPLMKAALEEIIQYMADSRGPVSIIQAIEWKFDQMSQQALDALYYSLKVGNYPVTLRIDDPVQEMTPTHYERMFIFEALAQELRHCFGQTVADGDRPIQCV